MKRSIYLFAICFVFCFSSFAQIEEFKRCGTSEIMQEALKNPEKKQVLDQLEIFTQEFIANRNNARQDGPCGGGPCIIPVVVHVLHDYGDENISYEQIDNGIFRINEDFNGENEDIADVIEAFQDIKGWPTMEFRLATKDPDGNCTYGVTRTATDLTYEASTLKAMSLVNWPDDQYINIYVVRGFDDSHPNAAAYASKPGQGTEEYGDFIFCQKSYFGDWFGGADGGPTFGNWARHTLPHEMGHFFNLDHPWGGSNSPGLPNLEDGESFDNCLIDDQVDDTPETIGVGNSDCHLDSISCDTNLDNVQNIMDYSNCALMFTQGQADRMIAAANYSAGNRDDLWKPENLLATGTDDDHFNDEPYAECRPIPQFRSEGNVSLGCAGVEIGFENATYNYRTEDIEYNWDFDGGIALEMEDGIQYARFDNPGTYDVSLEACVVGTELCNIVEYENYITILSYTDLDVQEGKIAFSQSFEDSSFPEMDSEVWWLRDDNENNNQNWEWQTFASSDGNASLRIKSQSHGERTIHEFSTPEINMDGLEINNSDPLKICFDYAYARRLPYNWVDWVSYAADGGILDQDNHIYPSIHHDDLIVKYKACGASQWTERPRLSTRPGLADGVGQYAALQDTLWTTDKIHFNSFIPGPNDWKQYCTSIQSILLDEDITTAILKIEFNSSGYEDMEDMGFDIGTYPIYANNDIQFIQASTIGGNWLYLDNIQIGSASLIENDDITARNNSENIINNLYIAPNPSKIGEGWVSFDIYEDSEIKISAANILGLNIGTQQLNLKRGSHNFKLEELFNLKQKGSYILTVEGPEFRRSQIMIIR